MAEPHAPIMIYTVLYAVDPESVQVIIRPSHGYLQDVVKVGNVVNVDKWFRRVTGRQRKLAGMDHILVLVKEEAVGINDERGHRGGEPIRGVSRSGAKNWKKDRQILLSGDMEQRLSEALISETASRIFPGKKPETPSRNRIGRGRRRLNAEL